MEGFNWTETKSSPPQGETGGSGAISILFRNFWLKVRETKFTGQSWLLDYCNQTSNRSCYCSFFCWNFFHFLLSFFNNKHCIKSYFSVGQRLVGFKFQFSPDRMFEAKLRMRGNYNWIELITRGKSHSQAFVLQEKNRSW